ncbi:replication-associated recombination protein A [Viridibacillus arvi]|uniref:replication-associated recombination protein A n=1 Tax=Viridibacillus arvi TaxID=263475 RepID=UPI003D04A81C
MYLNEPLAYRMRPYKIEDIVGQEKIIGSSSTLYKSIKNGYIPSLILYGPPGTGKTSIAFAIANSTKKDFTALHAASAGKKEIDDVIYESKLTRNTLLFIDEIHLLNKTQQDALLKALEDGTIVLIGATTENPYHSVRGAILSRMGQIKELSILDSISIKKLLKKALNDEKRGLGELNIKISDEQLDLISNSTGDARAALTLLETIVYGSDRDEIGQYIIETANVMEIISNRGFRHDNKGDIYYDLLSSFQKSIRGSDVDAALYYLARLLEGGDVIAIARRLLVIAYEDVGLANPELCSRILPAIETVERLGFPEGRIPLSVIVIELCLSAKSNSAYKALDKAINVVKNKSSYDIPKHLKDAHYNGAAKLGNGLTYLYPHDYPNGWVNQDYLPKELLNSIFYKPKSSGHEKYLEKTYERLNELKKRK